MNEQMQRHTQRGREKDREWGRYMKIYATASNCGVGDGPEISTIVFSIQTFSCSFFFCRAVCVCAALLCGCSLVGFGTIHDYYLHSAIIEGHCLICMWVRSHWVLLSFAFSLQFSYEDMLMAHHLEKRWKRLFLSALFRSEKLQPIKQKFADITAGEIEVFWDDVSWQSPRRLGQPDEESERERGR